MFWDTAVAVFKSGHESYWKARVEKKQSEKLNSKLFAFGPKESRQGLLSMSEESQGPGKYEPPVPEKGTREIVLPSGRYARMRPLMWLDMVQSYDENPFAWMAKLAVRVIEIDGVCMSAEHVLEMDMMEAMPVLNMLSEALKEVYKFRGGIK